MPDYKEMYFKLFRASEKVVSILTEAQRECEEQYIGSPEPGLKLVTLPLDKRKSIEKE